MNINSATLSIKGKVTMPVITQPQKDGTVKNIIPLLGNLTTWSKNNTEDIKKSIQNAITCFIKAANKYGTIEKELFALGWNKKEDTYHTSYIEDNNITSYSMII